MGRGRGTKRALSQSLTCTLSLSSVCVDSLSPPPPPSVLGVDGYNPSIIQYDQPAGANGAAPAAPAASSSAAPAAGAAKATPAPAPTVKKAAPSSSASAAASALTPEQVRGVVACVQRA